MNRQDEAATIATDAARRRRLFLALLAGAALAGCAARFPVGSPAPLARDRGADVVIYALGLVDTGYRYGGKNPEAGLDCSGMVSHIFASAAGVDLRGSAAEIARKGRPVDRTELRGGDLVFFNTLGRPFSHVGIYIGDGRFIHAPATNGKVRITRLDAEYFARRFEGARTYFD